MKKIVSTKAKMATEESETIVFKVVKYKTGTERQVFHGGLMIVEIYVLIYARR